MVICYTFLIVIVKSGCEIMKQSQILKQLYDLEKKECIEIVYACESGSRVWGFENNESDYDIRFIYKKRNIKDYLSLKDNNNVIIFENDELDIVGWDIKKALMLHYKNNPNLREMFLSNQIYIDKGIRNVFSGLGGFNIDTLKNHYASIAKKHWKKYCSLEYKKDKTKKYLYVIRSILCWKLLNRDIYPPINIHELLNHEFVSISPEVITAVNDLISYHQKSGQIKEDTIFKLNNFIMDSLNMMKTTKVKSFKCIEDYDERFRELLLVCR